MKSVAAGALALAAGAAALSGTATTTVCVHLLTYLS